MFHKVDPEQHDALTVSVDQLTQQLTWLKTNHYQTITLEQLTAAVAFKQPLPARSVLITFDDAYLNNLLYAHPVLEQFGMRAVLFVPTAFVGQCNEWDGCTDPLLTTEQLRQMQPTFELALHSHRHLNYKKLSATEIQTDLEQNIAAFEALDLPHHLAFAYPYGGRPKDPATRQVMQQVMQQLKIPLAFRIGNRLNRFPVSNRYELQRLDIRGTDSINAFIRKVRWGKLL
ncbi:hypothetical protein GCM10027347_27390 [Larkinella harenae]